MNPAKNCFTIPQNSSFLHSLADFILHSYDQEQYAKILILLPNRRSCRSLRDVFLECTDGKPLLLPRIQPIGEIEEEIFLSDITGAEMPVLQPIDPIRRHFLLMKLIMRFQLGGRGSGSAKQAAELALQLANFMDEVQREGVSFDSLSKLAPENLAGHWQQTLDFLTIITRKWPEVLAEEGAVDIVIHRNQLILEIAKIWKKSPPDYPVIAAGSTGSQPAIAELLKVIASLPQGKIILPALDSDMDGGHWEQTSETHPQYGLKKLLGKIDVDISTIPDLEFFSQSKKLISRVDYIRSIFAPPQITANWANCELPKIDDLVGIKLLEADTQLDEARAIAIYMRKALNTAEKTVALVTPDRTLARMVSSQLQRFGIMVDDSVGKPIPASAPACFLRLVVDAVATRFAPTALLALLRHPLAAAGINPAKCRSLSRELELLLLRGIRRDDSISGLHKAAMENTKTSPELIELLNKLKDNSAEFSALFAPHYNAALENLLAAHIKFAEWLATSDTQSGAQRLWAGEAGNKLADIIANWSIHASILPPIDALTYPALFETLLSPETYHSQIGLHPRLHILGPLEARLQSYDVVILGSLNEGTWPKNSQADPWMSRPQRSSFGLPSQEMAIGQSAHDFIMQLSAPEVLLTRSRKIEGTPTIPSRWLVRMKTLLAVRVPEFFAVMNEEEYFSVARNILEQPVLLPTLTAPAPTPPFEARPRKLRVTAIDSWLRNPYNIYSRYILNLRKLEEIDREPDASDFGNIVHKALEIFTREFPKELPDDMELNYKMLAAGRIAFADFLDRPAVACLWWPRFVAMANWLTGEEKIRRMEIEKIYSEVNASWDFEVAGNNFSLNTRIDRLEQLKTGSIAIIDYKTGTIPTKSDIGNGLSNQLPLEALIVQYGKLSRDIPSGAVTQMEYWKLSGNEEKCEITKVETDIEEARARLEELIKKFDDPTTPYAAQIDGISRYNDYEHLTRRREWEMV